MANRAPDAVESPDSGYVEIQDERWRFQVRVAAVVIWHDHVLLQKAIGDEFWVLPGGRVLPLETSASALARTMRWEIAQEVTVGRLLWVMEYVIPIGSRMMHELGMYYATSLPDASPFHDLGRDHSGLERGHDLVLRWFPVRDLQKTALFPEFLRSALVDPPRTPRHIVRQVVNAE